MPEGSGSDSDFVVDGDELKGIVRLARRRAMPFAFCPKSDTDEPLFATHRKKPPEIIARVTRRDSGQSKVAFGTFVVQGRIMVLTCQRELPAIAKRLKRHLKMQKLPMNVRVLDMTGVELEADLEDFDDPDPLGDDDGGDFTDPLDERIADMRPAVLSLKGNRGDRLRDMFGALLATRRDGPRSHAEDLADRLEDELRRLRNSGAATQMRRVATLTEETAPDEPVEVEDEDEDDDQDAEAELMRLARRAATLRRRILRLDDADAGGRLEAALKLVVGAIRADDAVVATRAMAQVEGALDRVEKRQVRPS